MEESAAARSALEADGYVVLPTGLPASILEAVVDDIWRHAGATPSDPATWYQPATIRPRPGMVEMYHYQSMWDVRQHPAVYRIFRDLHRTDELWVSIDRVAFKPPVRPGQPDYDQPGFIHWDTDINMYPDIPFQLQGVLALEDTSADMGGFQCVPSSYRDQQRFLDERSKAGPVPWAPTSVTTRSSRSPWPPHDLAIWKTTLLHGNGRNSAQRPRLAQYVTMNPLPPGGVGRETLRQQRRASWSTCALPGHPGIPRVTRAASRSSGVSQRRLARWASACWDWANGPMSPPPPDRLPRSARVGRARRLTFRGAASSDCQRRTPSSDRNAQRHMTGSCARRGHRLQLHWRGRQGGKR